MSEGTHRPRLLFRASFDWMQEEEWGVVMVVLSPDDSWGYAFLFLAVHVPSYDASDCDHVHTQASGGKQGILLKRSLEDRILLYCTGI